MNLEDLKLQIKDYAKDVRLNLDGVLSEEGAPGLSLRQIAAVALASAYATKNKELIAFFEAAAAESLDDTYVNACRGAATVMAMNNVYYRFLHFVGEESEGSEFSKMPARLRMNVIGKPGIEKTDFEFLSLAVSAIEGCGKCVTSHVHELKKAGASAEAIQSSIRIAAVVNSAVQALVIG
jgi:lipoyl-dependent peroxiredoxin subunit D